MSEYSRRPWWSARFLVFLIGPAIPVLVLGIALTLETRQWTTDRATANAASSAALVADIAIEPIMRVQDFNESTIDPQRTAELDAELQRLISPDLIRIKIWDRSGRVVYSDELDTVGTSFPVSHELSDALAGEVSSEISNLHKSENATEQAHDRLLEVYVPLRVGEVATIVGAFELYLPYSPVGDAISQDTRRIVVTLAAALVVLYLALLRISMDWARTRRQAADKDHEANHDPLTGLPNRRLFQSALEGLAENGGGNNVAVMFLDLDDFKHVNDTLGHAAGDELLQAVAGRLVGAVSRDTTVARLGGDEFALIVPNIVTDTEPTAIASRLIDCLAAPIKLGSGLVNVGASIGIAVAVAAELDPDVVQHQADNAMYMAKDAGKARHVMFEPAL